MSQEAPTPDLSLEITREYQAPRAAVYQAWVGENQMNRWAAPTGFTIPKSEAEVRPGGAWNSTMLAPDGTAYQLGGIYREIVPNELLSFTHSWEEEAGEHSPETLVTVRLTDQGTGTRMHFHQGTFATRESCDSHRGGWSECFDRLAHQLAATKA